MENPFQVLSFDQGYRLDSAEIVDQEAPENTFEIVVAGIVGSVSYFQYCKRRAFFCRKEGNERDHEHAGKKQEPVPFMYPVHFFYPPGTYVIR